MRFLILLLVIVVIAVAAAIALPMFDRGSAPGAESRVPEAAPVPHVVPAPANAKAAAVAAQATVPARKQPSPEGEELFQARGDETKIKALLARGVDVDSLNQVGWTALYAAAINDRVEPIRFLLDAGADPNAANMDGTTALGVQGCIALPVAELLVSRGAKVDAASDASGFTPLHTCAGEGDPAVVEFLLAQGAVANAVRVDGSTPLHDAAQRGHRAVIEVLLRHGADPAARDTERRTPLWVAIDHAQRDAVKALAPDAVLDVPNGNGITPLMKALYGTHEDIARWLVERGADVRARAASGETALHVAAAYASADMVRFLLDRGADVNAATDSGGSALDRAEHSDKPDIAALLRERGAHVERFRCEEQLSGGGVRSFVQRGGCPAGLTATMLEPDAGG
jgi:uncharacterized protein